MKDFDGAWRALVEEDATLTAPGRVEEAVMAEWSAARERQAHAPVRRWFTTARVAAVAAAMVLVALVVLMRSAMPPQPLPAAMMAVPATPSPIPSASSSSVGPPWPEHDRGQPDRVTAATEVEPAALRQARGGSARSGAPADPAPAVMTLAVDPILDTESLHIVRVRMPRGALRALGVALVEPEAAGLVDVDVLVGDDGLPRDIRRVRAVIEEEETIR